jgi:hypothetical protein
MEVLRRISNWSEHYYYYYYYYYYYILCVCMSYFYELSHCNNRLLIISLLFHCEVGVKLRFLILPSTPQNESGFDFVLMESLRGFSSVEMHCSTVQFNGRSSKLRVGQKIIIFRKHEYQLLRR